MSNRNLWILIAVLIGLAAFVAIYMRSCCKTQPPDGGFGLLQSNVPKYEYDCVTCDFGRYFLAKRDQTPLVLLPNARIEINSFLGALDRVLQVRYDDHGVIFHHGLLELQTGEVQYWPEVEFVGLKSEGNNRWRIVPIPNSRYAIAPNTGMLTGSNGSVGWSAYLTYMNRFEDSNSAAATKVVEGKDVRFYLHRYAGGLEELIAQNIDSRPTHLQVSSIAEPTRHSPPHMLDMRHHVSLALWVDNQGAPGRLLLDDTDYSPRDFRMKALDVGSPCPYRCAIAVLPNNGIPVRSSCVQGGASGCN